MKNKIILLISSIFLLLASFTLVYALLIDSREKGPIRYNVGKLDFTLTGSLIEQDLIYPGLNLVEESFVITNNSTIDTDIRIKFEITIDGQVKSLSDFNELLIESSVNTLSDFTFIDGYYYKSLESTDTEIKLIESLIFDGTKVKSNFSTQDFKIKLIFHAKQSSHAEFTDFGGTWLS